MDYNMKKIVPKSEFKIKAFELLRYVEQTGNPILISDHGKPTLQLSPIVDSEDDVSFFRNTVLKYESPLDPVAERDWELLT